MNVSDVLIAQYQATLAMLKQSVTSCPEAIWDSPTDRVKFWHIAYHALFYSHLYLQDSEQSFRPWSNHREEYQFIGPLPWPPHSPPQIGLPYAPASILEYLAVCQGQVDERVPQLNLEAASGFYWLPFSTLELQIYSIRHIQQHTGELMERLGTRAAIEINWVGTAQGRA